MHRVLLHPGLAGALLLMAASGCSSTSGSALPAARGLSPAAVQAWPETHQGRTAMLCGTIVAVHPRPDGTDIEVVGRPLDREGRPERGDGSNRCPILTYAQLLLWPSDTTTGGVYVGQKYWVWPYTFWWGPPPYVPRVTTW